MRGELLPGDRLPEIELAKQYGVSRPSFREALGLLHHLGVVCIEPRKGACVAHISAEDLQDVSEFRALLEDRTVRNAIPLLDAEDFRKLEYAVSVMKASAESMIIDQILEADKNFHFVIYEKSGNKMLAQALKNLTGRAQIYSFMYKKQRSTLICDL
jgi:DNA-binding GntR family transcriptional regulator